MSVVDPLIFFFHVWCVGDMICKHKSAYIYFDIYESVCIWKKHRCCRWQISAQRWISASLGRYVGHDSFMSSWDWNRRICVFCVLANVRVRAGMLDMTQSWVRGILLYAYACFIYMNVCEFGLVFWTWQIFEFVRWISTHMYIWYIRIGASLDRYVGEDSIMSSWLTFVRTCMIHIYEYMRVRAGMWDRTQIWVCEMKFDGYVYLMY